MRKRFGGARSTSGYAASMRSRSSVMSASIGAAQPSSNSLLWASNHSFFWCFDSALKNLPSWSGKPSKRAELESMVLVLETTERWEQRNRASATRNHRSLDGVRELRAFE